MKIRLQFKTPDVVHMALNSEAKSDHNKIKEACKPYIGYNEYLTVEVNISEDENEEATFKVLKVGE